MLHQTLSFILILSLSVVAPCRAQRSAPNRSAVRVLGDFSRISYPADDAFGYSLQLWQEQGRIFGLLATYTGAPSDPPTGLLEDVKFDPRTKKFSFSARLTTGLTSLDGKKWVPTRDRFTFKGVLTRTEVSGTLQEFDLLRPESRPISKKVRMLRSPSLSRDMAPPPATYADWKKWADEILQRRGPQW